MTTRQKWGATLCALALATLLAGCGHRTRLPLVPVAYTIETTGWQMQGSDTNARASSVEGTPGTVRTYVKYLGPTRGTSVHEPMYKCIVTYSEAGAHYYYVQRIAENEARHVSFGIVKGEEPSVDEEAKLADFGIVEGEEPSVDEEAKLADFGKVCGPLPDEG